ncbi:MAG TPA: VWA domain-containing protein [Ohtaekwangia sp.]|nr:VWA domain-containing protein [Ohtaekwangia sp.]
MLYRLIIIVLLLFSGWALKAQPQPQKLPDKTRLLFLVDASGSMLETWGRPNQSKLHVAKSILTKIVDSLRVDSKIEIGLRLYGHRFMPDQKKCTDTELVVPFKPQNHQAIIDRINAINPKGVTPISYALQQAASDFPATKEFRNIVIIITDGIESCGGDPCATSLALQKSGVILQPYIIGLGMKAEASLECAGKFVNADTPGVFHDVINQALKVSLGKTTMSLELIGTNQKPESNINVSFFNAITGQSAYEFVHFIDRNGKPDSVQVDPLIEYDLVVNTTPPIIKRNVSITRGKHTTVTIPVRQGDLVIRQEGNTNNNLQAIVREKGKREVIQVQQGHQPHQYLAGHYEVETITLPRRFFTVEIKPDKTTSLLIPTHGVVNFNTISTGYGSLYEMKDDGSQQWVMALDNMKSNFSLDILPGKYKVVFRVKNSGGSKYTSFKVFQVRPGQTVSVNVFQ